MRRGMRRKSRRRRFDTSGLKSKKGGLGDVSRYVERSATMREMINEGALKKCDQRKKNVE